MADPGAEGSFGVAGSSVGSWPGRPWTSGSEPVGSVEVSGRVGSEPRPGRLGTTPGTSPVGRSRSVVFLTVFSTPLTVFWTPLTALWAFLTTFSGLATSPVRPSAVPSTVLVTSETRGSLSAPGTRSVTPPVTPSTVEAAPSTVFFAVSVTLAVSATPPTVSVTLSVDSVLFTVLVRPSTVLVTPSVEGTAGFSAALAAAEPRAQIPVAAAATRMERRRLLRMVEEVLRKSKGVSDGQT